MGIWFIKKRIVLTFFLCFIIFLNITIIVFNYVGRSFFIKDDNNEKGLNENESKEVYQKVFSIDPEKSSKEKNSKKKCC